MKKRILFISILSIFSFILVACSNNAEEDSNQDDLKASEENKQYEEKSSETVEVAEVEPELSDEEIEEIINEIYSELGSGGELMSEKYEEYYETIDIGEFMDSGVDPNHPFYEEVHDLYYPEVKEVVAKEGMESIINDEFLLSRHHKNPTVFWPEYDDFEVLTKDSDYFKFKQTVFSTQDDDIGLGNNYDNDQIYIVEFVKEDDKWKFAGSEKQE